MNLLILTDGMFIFIQWDLKSFMLLLVLCHTVEINKITPPPTSSENIKAGRNRRKGRSFSDESMRLRHARGEVMYEGASPDETALVVACRRYGVVYRDFKDGYHVIGYLGQEESYEVLQILEFDADRKRMSVVVRYSSDVVAILVKGKTTDFWSHFFSVRILYQSINLTDGCFRFENCHKTRHQ